MAQAGYKIGAPGETPADLLAKLGPTLRVDVGLRSLSPPGAIPDLPRKNVLALVDTGAGVNAIDENLPQALGLPSHNESEVSGVTGWTRVNVYTARIYVPSLDRLIFGPLAGVKLQQGDHWRRLILGRPFLRPYIMTYDGVTGQVEIR